MLVEADIRADRRIVLPLGRQVEVLEVQEGRHGVLPGMRPADLRVHRDRSRKGDGDNHHQGRIEAPEDPEERLHDRQTARVQRIADLRAEEENTADEQEHVHTGGHPADEHMEDHHEGDSEPPETVDVVAVRQRAAWRHRRIRGFFHGG